LIEQGVRLERRIEDAVVDADVVMILRVQRERQTDAFFPRCANMPCTMDCILTT
jgi:aspartate carbamoyltransferase catalytic subunit